MSEFDDWVIASKTSKLTNIPFEIKEELLARTKYLSEDAGTRQRLYHLEHGPKIPKCKVCGVKLRWNLTQKAYSKRCFKKCNELAGVVASKHKWKGIPEQPHSFDTLPPVPDTKGIEFIGDCLKQLELESEFEKDGSAEDLAFDYYAPHYKLAFEVIWVKDVDKILERDRDAATHKQRRCSVEGINLVQFYEDEIENNPLLVFSAIAKITRKLKPIQAEACNIVSVTTKNSKAFLSQNHFSGRIKCNMTYGLTYNSDIVALAVFNKPQSDSKYDWELSRYCTKNGFDVAGGLEKLLGAFQNRVKRGTLSALCNLRVETGSEFNELRFKLDRVNPLKFYYVSNKNYQGRELRGYYPKKNHKKLLEHFDPELSEWMNMRVNGFERVWDCGTAVWVRRLR